MQSQIVQIRLLQSKRRKILLNAQVAYRAYDELVDQFCRRDVIEDAWKEYARLEDEAHALWIQIEELYMLANKQAEGSDTSMSGQLQEAGFGEGGVM